MQIRSNGTLSCNIILKLLMITQAYTQDLIISEFILLVLFAW